MPNPKRVAQQNARQGGQNNRRTPAAQAEQPEQQQIIPKLGHDPNYAFPAANLHRLLYAEVYRMEGAHEGDGYKYLTYGELVARDKADDGLLLSSNRLSRLFLIIKGTFEDDQKVKRAILGRRLDPVSERIVAMIVDAERRNNGQKVVSTRLAPRGNEPTVSIVGIKDELLQILYDIVPAAPDYGPGPGPAYPPPQFDPAVFAQMMSDPTFFDRLMANSAFQAMFDQKVGEAVANQMGGGGSGDDSDPR